MTMRKRDFLASLAFSSLATLPAGAADYLHGKNLGATPPEQKKQLPHRMLTTKNLFKVP
jgi:hypothetical protein